LARLFKKSYLTNEKELEHSENGPLGLCGNDKAPWPLSWVLFQVLRREKATRPHVGSKVEPAVLVLPETSSLVLPRAAADTRGQYSALHYAGGSTVRHAVQGQQRGAQEGRRGEGMVVRQQGLG
jgi:hypothetical protein